MIRVRDWRKRLSDLIEARRRVPFSSENNCAFFMADCIAAMSGVDLAAPYRGRFETVEEGMILLRREGFDDMGAFLAEHLEECHTAFAVAGDVMLIEPWAGGVVCGERVTVLSPQGLGTVPRTMAVRAFRV